MSASPSMSPSFCTPTRICKRYSRVDTSIRTSEHWTLLAGNGCLVRRPRACRVQGCELKADRLAGLPADPSMTLTAASVVATILAPWRHFIHRARQRAAYGVAHMLLCD